MHFLPEDIVELLVTHLDARSMSNFKRSVRSKWTTQHIFEHSRNILSQPVRTRRKCMQCNQDAISFLSWRHGQKRDWVPWCSLHIPEHILDDIDCFCIGDATCANKKWYV